MQRLEHRGGELGRHVELPAQFAHVGATRGKHRRVAHTDLADGGERERLVGEVRPAHLLQELPAIRPHHRQHCPGAGDVGQRGVRTLRQVAADPVGIARHLGRAGDDQEFVARQPGNGEIAFVGAALVQQPGIDRASHRRGNVVGAEMLEGRLRVPALHQELAERGFVGHRNGLARRLVLGCHRVEPGAATPAVLHVRRLADARKPVGPVPAHLVAEPRAARLEAIVKRRATERPAAFMLALRPRHLVVQAERLGDAVAQPGVVAVEIGEAADVDRPQIERRLAGDDPFGQRHAGPARTRDTHRIEPGADIEAAQSRRLAQDVAEIGREALRAVHEGLDTGFLQCRDADQRIVHQDLELVPVVRQHAELEIVGDDVLVPRLGLGLEAAHQKAAHLLLEVDVAVRIAHHRQVARHALHLLGDDVHVLAGIERHGDADHAPDLARPLAGAVHHHLGLDRALGRLHAGDCRSLGALLGVDRRHPRLLEDAYAVVARALGQRLGDVGWIGLAVARQPDRAHQVVGAHDGVLLARLFGRQLLAGDALGVGHRRRAAQIGHALWRARHRDRAALLPARRQSRLGLEPGIESRCCTGSGASGSGSRATGRPIPRRAKSCRRSAGPVPAARHPSSRSSPDDRPSSSP